MQRGLIDEQLLQLSGGSISRHQQFLMQTKKLKKFTQQRLDLEKQQLAERKASFEDSSSVRSVSRVSSTVSLEARLA